MAGVNHAELVEAVVREQRLFGILRIMDFDKSLAAAEALTEAGLKLLMVTLTVPRAFELLEQLASRGGLAPGAGSVTTMREALDAVDHGACFIDCPYTNRGIIDYCRDNKIFVAAGGLTTTEMMNAHLAGADLVKVFPVDAMGGVAYIKYVLEPLPFLRLMPVGGVKPEQAVAYIEVGAAAIGASSTLICPQALEHNDFDYIREQAERFLESTSKVGYPKKLF